MRHGYYLAHKDIFCGDEEYSSTLKDLYEAYVGFNWYLQEKPGPFDGASRYDYKGLVKTVVIVNGEIHSVFYQNEIFGPTVKDPDETNK